MKRSISVLIVALLIVITTLWDQTTPWQQIALAEPSGSSATIEPVAPPAAPDITAVSATLIDAKTGDVLFSKNPAEKRPMASTTKIMTALVALKYGHLDDVVTINGDVVGPGSLGGLGLSPGEHITLRDLLYALLLPSANDAAVAIADHVGGSVGGFADMMNQEAASIGTMDTHFTNPHGLDNAMHYSTAHDLAIIARQALQNPVFLEIASTKTGGINRPDFGTSTPLANHNALLSSYAGANGVKTGYTRGAGNCLVSSATRGEVSLISVVLNAGSRARAYENSSALLDYGFSLYASKLLISKGITYKKIPLKDGREVDLVAKEDVSAVVRDSLPISTELSSVTDVRLPVKKDAVLGKIIVNQAGRAIATSYLVVKEDIKPLPAKPEPAKPKSPKLLAMPRLAGYLFLEFIRKIV